MMANACQLWQMWGSATQHANQTRVYTKHHHFRLDSETSHSQRIAREPHDRSDCDNNLYRSTGKTYSR